jgi:hypothetical protein
MLLFGKRKNLIKGGKNRQVRERCLQEVFDNCMKFLTCMSTTRVVSTFSCEHDTYFLFQGHLTTR